MTASVTSASSEAIAATLAALAGFPELRGPRVGLRGPRDGDAQALFELFSIPEVMRYWSRPAMQSIDEACTLIEGIDEGFRNRTMLNWVITDAADVAIGSCTLFRIDPRHRCTELGYALHPAHWGSGIAREATSLALAWAFDALGLHRVIAGIDPDNEASRQLLLRHGFQFEGRLRQSYFVGDTVTDEALFGLLASEWRERDRG